MARLPADDPDSEQLATPAEKLSAWKALTADDKKRIAVFAEIQAEFHKYADPGITGEDLIQQATDKALHGPRSWRLKEITFVQFMFGLIRSIAGDLARTKAGKVRAASLSDEELLGEHTDETNPESILIDRERESAMQARVDALQAAFEDDETAWYVLQCIQEGLKPRAIRQRLNLSVKDFDSARNRISRRIAKLSRPN